MLLPPFKKAGTSPSLFFHPRMDHRHVFPLGLHKGLTHDFKARLLIITHDWGLGVDGDWLARKMNLYPG